MTTTNHLLAGSIIGLAVNQPLLALSLAFISHFVMDALPHFGYPGNNGYTEALRHKLSYVVAVPMVLTTLLVMWLLGLQSQWFALLCGLVALSPDTVGIYNYWFYERKRRLAKGFIHHFHIRFHRAIQHFERPWGIYIEIIVFISLFELLAKLI